MSDETSRSMLIGIVDEYGTIRASALPDSPVIGDLIPMKPGENSMLFLDFGMVAANVAAFAVAGNAGLALER